MDGKKRLEEKIDEKIPENYYVGELQWCIPRGDKKGQQNSNISTTNKIVNQFSTFDFFLSKYHSEWHHTSNFDMQYFNRNISCENRKHKIIENECNKLEKSMIFWTQVSLVNGIITIFWAWILIPEVLKTIWL